MWSLVQKQLLPRGKKPNKMHPAGIAKDWTIMKWAAWWRPFANGTEVAGVRDDHPVVHVSWNDAYLYCLWAGRRLPSEAEWELAARGGGKPGHAFPWGDEPTPGGEHRCNAWDGPFPRRKKGFKTTGGDADGFIDTCPVREFAPDANGLFNMVGNVWEWTMSRYRNGFGSGIPPQQVMRGGSYVGALVPEPAPAGRTRAGITARQGFYPDTGFGDTGFRCAANLPGKKAPPDVEWMMRVLGPHMHIKFKKRPTGSHANTKSSKKSSSTKQSGGGGGGRGSGGSSSAAGGVTGGSKKKPLSTKNVKLYAGVGLLLICVLAVVLGGSGDEEVSTEAAPPAAAKKDDTAKKEK